MRWMSVGVPLLGVFVFSGSAGCSTSDGDSGPPQEFVTGPSVTVSGPSPISDCELEPREGWANAELEPWLVVNPTNPKNIVGFWFQDSYPRRALVAGVSFDGGETWESVVLPGLSKCSGGDWDWTADPWLTFSPNGELHASALSVTEPTETTETRTAILALKSVDGGLTWTDPIVVSEYVGQGGEDKESILADPNEECTVYAAWTRFVADGDDNVMFSKTSDCGESWSEPEVLFASQPAGIGALFEVTPEGEVLLFFREWSLTPVEHPVYMMRSTDRGETWSAEPDVIGMFVPGRAVAADSSTLIRDAVMSSAIDPVTGELHLVWEHVFDGTQPVQIALMSSSDGGRTWSEPMRIDKTPDAGTFVHEQAFLPGVHVTDDGTIGITYYNFENDVAGDGRSDSDVWFIHCHPDFADCGDRDGWSEGVRLTEESFDYQGAPEGNRGLFLADYTGLTSWGSDFYALIPVSPEGDPSDAVFVPILGQ